MPTQGLRGRRRRWAPRLGALDTRPARCRVVLVQVALNIVQNGCVSLSEPTTGACEPDWGGNQLPGYPAFIALVWAVSGASPLAVRVGQALVVVGAGLWLVHAVARYTGSWRAAFFVGLVMALSPLQVAWPRLALTETLALATTMWVLAELMLSLAENRMRVWTTGFALTAAVFVRYDGVLLCLPVAFCAFVIHGPKRALLRGGAIALIVALPVLAWVARSADAGLGYVPRIPSLASLAPVGFVSWTRTWSTHEYDLATVAWPMLRHRYTDIRIDGRAFDNDEEAAQIATLLDELARFDGEPFPQHVDGAFAALAAERRTRDPVRHWLWNPLRRAANMWFKPVLEFRLASGCAGHPSGGDTRLDFKGGPRRCRGGNLETPPNCRRKGLGRRVSFRARDRLCRRNRALDQKAQPLLASSGVDRRDHRSRARCFFLGIRTYGNAVCDRSRAGAGTCCRSRPLGGLASKNSSTALWSAFLTQCFRRRKPMDPIP